jgi:hypothetical protein
MFGFGDRRRVRQDTFSSNRVRNALLAGAGMLAWRWWRNRQGGGVQSTGTQERFSDSSRTPSAGAYS